MQAADLLAFQGQVQEVCSVLAARPFASKPQKPIEQAQLNPTQVILCTFDASRVLLIACTFDD
jgi:hypothetical protein